MLGCAKIQPGRVQRLVCLIATGAMRSTLAADFEMLLGVKPLDFLLRADASA